jgi:hypothetical protein
MVCTWARGAYFVGVAIGSRSSKRLESGEICALILRKYHFIFCLVWAVCENAAVL